MPPPWTKKETNRTLNELRSDPEKLKQFKLKLRETRKNLNRNLPKYHVHIAEFVSNAFLFLVRDYGYTECEKRIAHTGARGAKYESENVVINIWVGGYDSSYFCGIYFGDASQVDVRDDRRRNYCFRQLLNERCPLFEFPAYAGTAENLKSHIDAHAFALEKYARDVITGNFEVFRP